MVELVILAAIKAIDDDSNQTVQWPGLRFGLGQPPSPRMSSGERQGHA